MSDAADALQKNIFLNRTMKVGKLEIGPGTEPQPGYEYYMDVLDNPYVTHKWNIINQPWPFADNSLDEILGIHIWEHITVELGMRLMKEEVFRVLKPGGRVRIHVPSRETLFWRFSESTTPEERVDLNRVMYGQELYLDGTWQHKALYDQELLSWTMKKAGFGSTRDYSNEQHDRHDNGWRWLFGGKNLSLKVEGTK